MDRALVLFQQSRYDLAESELRAELSANPLDAPAHALLSLCLSQTGYYGEATGEAEESNRIAANSPFAHYALAFVFHSRRRLKEGTAAVDEAIRLDPLNPDYFALLSNILADTANLANRYPLWHAPVPPHNGQPLLQSFVTIRQIRPVGAVS